MWSAASKRWRDRLASRDGWFALWLGFLAGLSIWFAWHHLLFDALWPAALAVAFAVVRN
jgi:hypothetical protein